MISKRNSCFSAKYNMPETEIKKTKEHPDLYKKVIKGGFWVFALRIFTQLMSILRLAILARILSKTDFGLIGIALLLISILGTITQTGFQAALVQKKENITPFLNTAWTTNIIRGIILYSLLYFIAPFAAKIKVPIEQYETALAIIRVTGLSIIIGSLSNIGIVYFQKDLQFNKTFQINSISNLLGIAISIIIAIIYKSPWALVAGRLTNTTISVLLSYILHPFKPKLNFEKDKFLELWHFGRWVTGSSIIGFFVNYGDDFFVWFFLGTEALGLYQMAYRIAMIPADFGSSILSKITFPAFSKVSNDIERLKKAYFKTYKFASSFSIPSSVAILILSPIMIPLILGDKWIPAIILIQILTIKGTFLTLGATRGPLFLSLNKPGIGTKFRFLRLITLSITIYPLCLLLELKGVCIAVTLSCLLPMAPAYNLANKLLNATWKDIIESSKTAILVGIITGLLSLAVKYVLNYFF
ncbi:MAG: lipopolysaccharide biosynthesis protein [Sedimentisphaeraceae bacterium JB056]